MNQNWIDVENEKATQIAELMDTTLENILNSRKLERQNKAMKAKMIAIKQTKDQIIADYNKSVEMVRQLPPQFDALAQILSDRGQGQNEEIPMKIKKYEDEIAKIRKELDEAPAARRELERINLEIAQCKIQQSKASVVKQEPQEEMLAPPPMVSSQQLMAQNVSELKSPSSTNFEDGYFERYFKL